MRRTCLSIPNGREIRSRLESIVPDAETDDHGEEATGDCHVAVELKPTSCHGHDHCWNRDEEGEEDHDSISDGS